jgi:O-antigen/teichoic acid export membrane protein
MNLLLRLLVALSLLAVAGFCAFGFLATFEYAEPMRRLPWQVGYAGIALACFSTLFLRFRRRPQAAAHGVSRPAK